MMDINKNEVFIVIAAYNESKSIKKVVGKLTNKGYYNVVVVDDGSKDNTFSVIKNLSVYSLKHTINRGQGAALKTGIDFALKQGAKYVVTFDADGQHDVNDLSNMIKPVFSKKYDVSLGSRFLNKKTKMPFARYLTLKIGVIVQFIFYGLLLTDDHNGYRCFSRNALEKMTLVSDRMEHASEIIEEIKKKKLKFVEVPVSIHYSEYTLQKGHGSFFGGIVVLFKMLMKKFL